MVLVLGVSGALGFSAASFGSELRDGDQLLPGVTVAGVEVGGSSRAEATDAVTRALATHLDGEVVVTHDAGRWTTTPRELGARTDLDQVLADAFSGTVDASLPQLVATRWLGSTSQLSLDVTITRDAEAEAGLIAEVAGAVDLDPTEATVTWSADEGTSEGAGEGVGEGVEATADGDQGAQLWTAGQAQVTAHRDGRVTDTELLAEELSAALDAADVAAPTEVAVPTDVVPATLTTAAANRAATTSDAAVAAALDRPVEVAFEDMTFTVTAREAGARFDGAAVIAASLTAPDTDPEVALELEAEDLTSTVAAIASEVDIAAASATGSYTGGQVQVSRGTVGRSVSRATTRELLATALMDGGTTVELPVQPVQPAVTSANFDTTLVVRQSARVVELHRGGQLAGSWPVAVGTGGSPTPTGNFTIGAKRFEPTWVNPAPDRWGADLPARVGPGPDNPLGLRALNWNRVGGGDTLIRFHGTPNEDSIGEAASNGCVRMFNDDVVQLYDLVPSGAMVISIG